MVWALDSRRSLLATVAAGALLTYIRLRCQKPAPKPIEYTVAVRADPFCEGNAAYLVTGGAGMLGGHILAQLRSRYPGSRLFSLDLAVPPPPKQVEGVTYIRCDLINPAHLEKAFDEARSGGSQIAAVLHIAAVMPAAANSWPVFEKVNIKGTAALVDKALEKGAASFIYCGSATAVLDLENPNMEGVKGEELPYPTKYVDLYARSKALGEMEVLKRNGKQNANGKPMLTCAIRVSAIVDANDRAYGQHLPRGSNNAYFFPGTQVIDWVWAVDVARCFVAATRAVTKRSDAIAGKAFHCGGFTKRLAFKDWVGMPDPENPGRTLWGNRVPPVPLPRWLVLFAAHLNMLGQTLLGFPPIDPHLRPDTFAVCDGTLSWWWDLTASREAFGYEPTPVDQVIRNVRDTNHGMLESGEAFAQRGRLPSI